MRPLNSLGREILGFSVFKPESPLIQIWVCLRTTVKQLHNCDITAVLLGYKSYLAVKQLQFG